MRPLVEAGRGVDGQGDRGDRLALRKAEQKGPARGRAGGGREGGRPDAPRQVRVEQGRAQPRAELVADHTGGQQACAGDARAVGQGQQRGPDHDAMVADRGGVHVLAQQGRRHRRHGEGRLGRRGGEVRRRDGDAVRRRMDQGERLAAGRQVARLEHAAQGVGQAQLRLGRHVRALGLGPGQGLIDAAPDQAHFRISTPAHSSSTRAMLVKSLSAPYLAVVIASIWRTAAPATIGTPRASASSTHMRTSL